MANRFFYTYTSTNNDSKIPNAYLGDYYDSLIFDPMHRTIWHQGWPYGNVYPGTAAYGEIFNNFEINIAEGPYSHAEGNKTAVVGLNSYASHTEGGMVSISNTSYSHAEGFYVQIEGGAYNHAEGYYSHIGGSFAVADHVEGCAQISNGSFSHAEGGSQIWTSYAHAEGISNIWAAATYSHAEGINTTSNGRGSHVEGSNSVSTGNYSHAEGVESNSEGEGSHAEGHKTVSRGNYSHAEGDGSSSFGAHSHAEGLDTKADGIGSHTEGYESISLGEYSHAEGSTVSTGNFSHSEGFQTSAIYKYSHAEGQQTYACGVGSHVEGHLSSTNADYSHAEGVHTTTYGEGSHAGGVDSYTYAKYSIAIGNFSFTLNNAVASFASGTGSYTSNQNEHALGQYNQSYSNNDNSDTIFEIGIGSGENDRRNAFEIRKDGTGYFYNNLFIYDPNNNTFVNPGTIETVGKWNEVPNPNTGIKYTYAEYFNDYTTPNLVYADYAHAEGYQTYVHSGKGAHTEGVGTEVYNDGEHASGHYNKSTLNSTLFSVGDGTSSNNRHNAFEILNDGAMNSCALVSGNPVVTSIDDTCTYIWKGVYSDYEKISEKDPNTLYFIDDGDGNTGGDTIVSPSQITNLQNQITELKALLADVVFKSKLSSTSTTYLWTGTLSDFNGLDKTNDKYAATTFIVNPN